MDKFVHQENLTLFKRRLEQSHTDAEHEVLLKLLAEEEAKERHPKKQQESGKCTATSWCQETPDAPEWGVQRASGSDG